MLSNKVHIFNHPISADLRKTLYTLILDAHSIHNYKPKENNMPVDGVFFESIKRIFEQKCMEIYGVNKIIPDNREETVWCYITGKDFYKGDNIHNHINSCTYVGVYYLNVPTTENKFDGCVKFYDFDFNVVDYFFPKNDDFIIFESDLYHSITNPKTEEYRISINVELSVSKNIEFIQT